MVVFLDIDGVLNRKQDRRVPYRLHQPCVKEFKKFLSKVGDLKIVLISSWRHGFISSGNKNNSPQIKELDNVLFPYRIVGKTSKGYNRDVEIMEFVRSLKLTEYLIIDDASEYSKLNPYLCDCKTGWTTDDTKKCKSRWVIKC